MRAFLTCACLTIVALGVSATSAHADHWYRPVRVVVGLPAPVIVRPAPIIVTAPAPVVVAPPVVVSPGYAPAPVVVGPVVRPLVSLRFGIGR